MVSKDIVIRKEDAFAFMELAENEEFSFSTDCYFHKDYRSVFAFRNCFKDEDGLFRDKIYVVYADDFGKFDSQMVLINSSGRLNSIDGLVLGDEKITVEMSITDMMCDNLMHAQESVPRIRSSTDNYRSYEIIPDSIIPYRVQAESLGIKFNVGLDVLLSDCVDISKTYSSRIFVEQEFSKAARVNEYYALQNPSTLAEVFAFLRSELSSENSEVLKNISKINDYVAIPGTYTWNGSILYLKNQGNSYTVTSLASNREKPHLMFKSLRQS
jgi:hypothetical protein